MTENNKSEITNKLAIVSNLDIGLQELIQRDRDLAQIVNTLGKPPNWQRQPGFATLIQIILEQQVSLTSAKAAYDRLRATVEPLTPENFLTLDALQLRAVGFSRQKSNYALELASAIVSGRLNLNELQKLDDWLIRSELTKIKGIGNWTVDMYLMMALQRPDVFPVGDLAVAVAVQRIKNLATRPKPVELLSIAEAWRPWRAIATKILWHYYLNNK
ncbi:DNA-3-methyladenine glycosylase [Myxosarcina sp. GI1]|uniref:DNA-3-methyladenine glycosylase family protein n=1 Tax=Myxosarcina sp. GI1 TaxID=1541065 RepID=UPI000A5671F3|nr:DNA-3-methyladenine glycosylase 2 family protein [Myxosarcina sp. GI1]